MKRFLISVAACVLLATGIVAQSSPNVLPRIAIAGLGIESSTFSPAVTHEPAFHARYGSDVYKFYPFLNDTATLRKSVQWVPTVVGKSLPGGAVTREAYKSLTNNILDSLKKHAPYSGLYFDIHGAMSVQGLDDPEGDLITRIRAVVGYKTLISTSMDLHGNVSQRLAQHTDLITCYRMAPHEDAMQTKERAVLHLINRLRSGKGKPAYKALIAVPILLPGEKTSTRIEPGKSLYAQVAPLVDGREGVVDGGIWIGYAWADEPRNHAAVMVTGDDKIKVVEAAEKLATHFWSVRKQFDFVAPTGKLDAVLTKAIAAGVGNNLSGKAGAVVDARFAPPVPLNGTVTAIEYGDRDAEIEVVVKVGSVQVIVTKKRKPYHEEDDFTRLGLNPRTADIVVVKIGYLQPELYDMQKDWIMALTPGGVDQDLARLPYKRIQRPLFPFDADMKTPDLSAQLIPVSGAAD